MTASELLAKVRPLLNERPDEALGMLLLHRPGLADDAFDVDLAIIRASYQAGEADRAASLVGGVLAAKKTLGQAARALCAEVLIVTGHAAEAVALIQRAVSAGTPLEDLSVREQAVLHDVAILHADHARSAQLDALTRARNTLANETPEVAFTHCPKNACTVMKATMVMNGASRQDYLNAKTSIHNYCTTAWPKGTPPGAGAAGECFSFTIVRDPLGRLLSAYLNKFVTSGPQGGSVRTDKHYTILGAQKHLGIPIDPARSITFEEFCIYLQATTDAQLNEHWRPQWRFVGTELGQYDHVGRVETLAETFALLSDKFGYTPETDPVRHTMGSPWNVTRFSETLRLAAPDRMLPSQLLAHKRTGFPPAESFYSPAIEAAVRTRYARDYELAREKAVLY